MVFQTGGAGGNFERPKVAEDFYVGKLVSVKETKNDGSAFEAKFGKKAIFEFQLFYRERAGEDKFKLGAPVQSKEKDIVLGHFIYVTYKGEKKLPNGEKMMEERSAFTGKSTPTKFLESLGWKFQENVAIDPAAFIGRYALLTVKTLSKDKDGKALDQPYSVIDSVSEWADQPAFENEAANATPSQAPTSTATYATPSTAKTYDATKVKGVVTLKVQGLISEQNYPTILKQEFGLSVEEAERIAKEN